MVTQVFNDLLIRVAVLGQLRHEHSFRRRFSDDDQKGCGIGVRSEASSWKGQCRFHAKSEAAELTEDRVTRKEEACRYHANGDSIGRKTQCSQTEQQRREINGRTNGGTRGG